MDPSLRNPWACLRLEVVVVVIGLGSESDFLYHHFCGLRFLLLLAFFLLVEELLVVYHAAHRRFRRRADHHQIKLLLLCNAESLLQRMDTLLYIVTYETHLTRADVLVDDIRLISCSRLPLAGRCQDADGVKTTPDGRRGPPANCGFSPLISFVDI